MDMKISDTMSGKLHEVGGKEISIYLCGVTVYDKSHIGHARTIVVFDVLSRHLELNGINVKLVQNFTDVDDKIIARAKKDGSTAKDISEKYMKDYYECFDVLNVKRAFAYPLATAHIEDMIEFISNLIKSEAAYATENGVYFAVEKFSEYGKLSKKDVNDLQAGARVKVDEQKHNPMDFALWKNSSDEPSWNSPWGKGRPGWHIECSVMCQKYLGDTFDIHGGGRDLIFPHHENEIAQSESRNGKLMAKTWMHVGMVTVDGEKMSKSVGNVRQVADMLEKRSPNVIRMFCLGTHYSKPVDYTEEVLDEHESNWGRVRLAYHMLLQCKQSSEDSASKAVDLRKKFDDALDDDLNTHGALMALNELSSYCTSMGAKLSQDMAKQIRPVFEYMMSTLGLVIKIPSDEEIERINQILERRNELREQKKYAESDALRDELGDMNVEIIDEVGHTTWMIKDN